MSISSLLATACSSVADQTGKLRDVESFFDVGFVLLSGSFAEIEWLLTLLVCICKYT